MCSKKLLYGIVCGNAECSGFLWGCCDVSCRDETDSKRFMMVALCKKRTTGAPYWGCSGCDI